MSDYLYTEVQAKKAAFKILKKLKKIFGIEHYEIIPTFRWRKKEKGSCRALAQYEKAMININLEKIASQEDLELVCLHEMLHVIADKLDSLTWELAEFYDGGDERVMEKELSRQTEALTTHLTRVLYPLIFT